MGEYRVTFGQQYPRTPHPEFPEAHKDGYVTIVAEDAATARAEALRWLGQHWAFFYDLQESHGLTEAGWQRYYPLGELARREVL